MPTPGAEAFRVFIQGVTGFVSMGAVRDDAEHRAAEYCGRKEQVMDAISETTANPPYVLGNFPRIEIVFECFAAKSATVAPVDKYGKIAELKKLLDSGALTQAEFDSEKAKILEGK